MRERFCVDRMAPVSEDRSMHPSDRCVLQAAEEMRRPSLRDTNLRMDEGSFSIGFHSETLSAGSVTPVLDDQGLSEHCGYRCRQGVV